jgi:hypothetical protein
MRFPFYLDVLADLPVGAAVPDVFSGADVVRSLTIRDLRERRGPTLARHVRLRAAPARVRGAAGATSHDLEWLVTARPVASRTMVSSASGRTRFRGRTFKQSGILARCRACGAASFMITRWPSRPSGRRASASALAPRIVELLESAFGRSCDEAVASQVLGL